jgi:predicted  nucleic acid-binding Zn-ribbon protein
MSKIDQAIGTCKKAKRSAEGQKANLDQVSDRAETFRKNTAELARIEQLIDTNGEMIKDLEALLAKLNPAKAAAAQVAQGQGGQPNPAMDLQALVDKLNKQIAQEKGKLGKLDLADDKRKYDSALAKVETAADDTAKQISDTLDLLEPMASAKSGIPPSLIDSIKAQGREEDRSFLTITTQEDALDPLVRQALDEFAANLNKATDPDDARGKLAKNGIASHIGKVTSRLSRQRMSPMRRAILSRAYVHILLTDLNAAKMDSDEAEDTVGLSDQVQRLLEGEKGQIDQFCELLAKKAVGKMHIDAVPGSREFNLIAAQLRASI